VNLPVFGRLPSGLLRTHIPTVGLTPIRRITNGLGNIVRRIEFGEGDVGPASRELETRITEYLAQQRDGRSTIDVWALIIPRDAFSGKENESEKDSMAEGKDVRGAWRSKALSSQYISNWLDKGATLCRVRKSAEITSREAAIVLIYRSEWRWWMGPKARSTFT
jgi:hypothetical protein